MENGSPDLNPLLDVMSEVGVAPLEIIPSPNALEELFIQALETPEQTA